MDEAWRRAVAALDGAIAVLGHRPPGDDGERWFGWTVRPTARRVHVEPAWCWGFAKKSGFRTARCELRDVPSDDPQDRLVADVLALDRDRGERSPLLVLELLAGHPRVVLEPEGEAVAVSVEELELHWLPTDAGGVVLEPRIQGLALDRDALELLLATVSGYRAVRVDAARRRLAVVRLGRAALRLLAELDAHGTTFPAEAGGALLARYADLRKVLPCRLHGSLRGDEVPADERPVVRLDASPDGRLRVEVRARPLPDGPVYVPGEGPEEVETVREGRRIRAARDRAGEVERARTTAEALGLSPSAGASWSVDDAEHGLAVLHAVRSRGDRVEWSRPPPAVVDAGLEDLAVEVRSGRDWFSVRGGLRIDGDPVPLALLLAAIRARRRFVRVRDGTWAALARPLEDALRPFADAAWEGADGVEVGRLAPSLLTAAAAGGATVVAPPEWTEREARIREAAELDPPVPGGLRAELRPYQREGFAWLARLAHWAPGAVLADDMGLGKTVQALALVLRRADAGPTLVVAPASVEINWERETARFAPSLRVLRYRGPRRAQALEGLGPSDVVVASWGLLHRDGTVLAAVPWATVVLDEAHAVKNASSGRSKASTSLSSPFTLALTGTPVENRLAEVWSLFRTVVPGLLGPEDRFRDRDREAIARQIRPFVLRRLKRDVAPELPPRSEVIVPIELSGPERRRYEAVRAAALAELGGERLLILAAMTRLRQLACHPRLVEPDADVPSSKLERLVELATDLAAGGHRTLVFSQFATLLHLAREGLEDAGLRVLLLEGATPVGSRSALVDAFQRGEADVFLISLQAGGVGLNLTAASYVVHLDPWWNPAVEDQATDRAHRIGQSQPVTVLKLVAVGTIEEQVLGLHADKRGLVEDLLSGTDRAGPISADQLLELLR